jgi:hypothetical protein
MRRVEVDAAGCWIWTGSLFSRRKDYGQFWADGTNQLAHRWAYQQFIGPVPDGLEVDHTCRVTVCVNPVHLEAVTAAENHERRDAARRAA